VTYVDVDPQTIAALSSKLIDTPARFSQGIVSNCSPLPLPDAYASRIIAMEVIEHVESPIETLKELVRIGKPGALYLIAVPDKIGEDIQKNIAPNAYFEHPNHIHIFSRDKFSSLIKESGLDVLQHDYYGFFWTMWMLIYWVSNKASNDTNQEIAHDTVQPPYYPLLNNWASLWYQFNKISEANIIKKQLDELMPKSQIIVAQKPLHHEK
jgi:SAM-dependent methyltransferase